MTFVIPKGANWRPLNCESINGALLKMGMSKGAYPLKTID